MNANRNQQANRNQHRPQQQPMSQQHNKPASNQPANPTSNGAKPSQPAAPSAAPEPDGKMILNAILEGKAATFTPLAETREITLTIGLVKAHLSNKTRKGFEPNDSDCVKYIMMCMQRGLNPWAQDCYLLGYDTNDGPKFSMVVAIQALLKRAELARTIDKTAAFDGMDSGVVVEVTYQDMNDKGEFVERKVIEEVEGDMVPPGAKLLGGWARAWRKDRSRPYYQRLDIGTYRKDTPMWRNDGPGMICKCSEAAALRQAFPSDIGGLYLEDEINAFAEEASKVPKTPHTQQTGAGGHYTLDTLSGKAAEPNAAAAQAGEQPGNDQAGNQQAGEAVDTVAEGETSEQVVEQPVSDDGGVPEQQFGEADDAEHIMNWQADIDQAKTDGALSNLADDAATLPPGKVRTTVLELIGQARAKLHKPKTKSTTVPSVLFLLLMVFTSSAFAVPPQAAKTPAKTTSTKPGTTQYFDSKGRLAGRSVTTRNGNSIETRHYDSKGMSAGRDSTRVDSSGRASTYSYDAKGGMAGRSTTRPSTSSRPVTKPSTPAKRK